MATEKTLAEDNQRLKAELEATKAELAKKEASLQKYKGAMKVGKEAIMKLQTTVQQLQDLNSSSVLDSSLVPESGNSDDAERDKKSTEALRGRSGSFYNTVSENKAVSAAVVIAAAATAVMAYRRFG